MTLSSGLQGYSFSKVLAEQIRRKERAEENARLVAELERKCRKVPGFKYIHDDLFPAYQLIPDDTGTRTLGGKSVKHAGSRVVQAKFEDRKQTF